MTSGPSTPRSPSPAARAALRAIRFYQVAVSPLKMGPTCRFEPSCSAYAHQAVRRFGVLRGIPLAMARLAKCGPWHPGGMDPVPAGPSPTTTCEEF